MDYIIEMNCKLRSNYLQPSIKASALDYSDSHTYDVWLFAKIVILLLRTVLVQILIIYTITDSIHQKIIDSSN